eukprot:3679713-Amphidinium_carterae.1
MSQDSFQGTPFKKRSWVAQDSQLPLTCEGLKVTALGMDFSGLQARVDKGRNPRCFALFLQYTNRHTHT